MTDRQAIESLTLKLRITAATLPKAEALTIDAAIKALTDLQCELDLAELRNKARRRENERLRSGLGDTKRALRCTWRVLVGPREVASA